MNAASPTAPPHSSKYTIVFASLNRSSGSVMQRSTQPASDNPRHGYPHLGVIKESIKLLYKSLSSQRLKSFSKSLTPLEAAVSFGDDIVIGVHSLAGVIVRHLQLPKACIIVRFRDMENPGQVELSSEDDYLVDLNNKYRNDHRDIAAILAHEITHVFLHRHGIQVPDTLENEILTDTAAVYLGVGWLSSNAHRVTEDRQERYIAPDMREVRITTTDERLGYLTPEEFGYVLGKRSLALGEKMTGLITSPAGKMAFDRGYRTAVADHQSAPIVGCGWWRRSEYYWNRRHVRNVHRSSGLTGRSRLFRGYQFEVADSMRVIFECPVCSQKLRLPTDQQVDVRCSICDTSIGCRT